MTQFLQLFSDDKSAQDFSFIIQFYELQHTSSFNNDFTYNLSIFTEIN